jgi:predicted phage tail protein
MHPALAVASLTVALASLFLIEVVGVSMVMGGVTRMIFSLACA